MNCRAVSWFALDCDSSPVLLHNTMGDTKAEAGAARRVLRTKRWELSHGRVTGASALTLPRRPGIFSIVMASSLLARIVVNPTIQHGKSCLKDTRTPVYVVLEALAHGLSIAEIQREYPPLTSEDVLACLEYAALLADEQETVPQLSPGA